jgi:hypothetical protein
MDQAPPPPPPPPAPPPPPPPPGGTTLPQRGVGDLLSAAFELYKDHWQTLMGITAVVVVPVAFIQAFITHQLTGNVTVRQIDVGTGTQVVVHTSAGFGRTLLASIVLGLLSIFVWALLTGAITRAVVSDAAGVPSDLSDSYGFAGGRALSIIWIGLLAGLAIGIGFVFLIIPGIFLLVKFCACVPAMVVEGRRGTAALGRSWNLTTGWFWHVLGALVLAWLISVVVGAILSAPFSAWPVRAIGQAIAQIVTLPFTTTVGVLIYLDLRARREALTVEMLRTELQAA